MSWTAPDIVTIRSLQDGVGVFAQRPILKRSVIGIFQGVVNRFPIIDGEAVYGDENKHLMLDLYRDADALYALTLPDVESPVNRINHSCKPNAGLVGIHGVTMIALRDIDAGEEITFDYRPVTLMPVGAMCWCAEPKCHL